MYSVDQERRMAVAFVFLSKCGGCRWVVITKTNWMTKSDRTEAKSLSTKVLTVVNKTPITKEARSAVVSTREYACIRFSRTIVSDFQSKKFLLASMQSSFLSTRMNLRRESYNVRTVLDTSFSSTNVVIFAALLT